MTDTGDGSGATTFVLDATRSHDADSRLVGATDDNGNTTLYQYDPLDRRHTTIYPDGPSESMSYDVHGNPVQIVDPNGTVTTATFDLANRLVTRSIARAPGVLGTTAELWKYDGLSRVVFASNDVAVVTRQYDSLSDVTQETQTVGAAPARTLTSAYDGAGQLTSMTYPSNINVVATRDAIGNVKTLTTSGPNVCAGGPTPGVLCANDSVCGLEGHCQPLAAAPITFDYAGRDRLVRRQCCKA
jgi:YD repeat-containing protein